MTKRNRDALAISDGACNPVAIVNSMRCYVASKLGDVVEVPEELT